MSLCCYRAFVDRVMGLVSVLGMMCRLSRLATARFFEDPRLLEKECLDQPGMVEELPVKGEPQVLRLQRVKGGIIVGLG